MKILVVSDGRRGIENQALGLAEAVIRQISEPTELTVHRIKNRRTFSALPPGLQLLGRKDFGLPEADLIIGCGRQAIAPLISQKRRQPSLSTCYVQDPRVDPSHFDLVIAPEHDDLSGPHVIRMIGSPSRVTRDRLVTELLRFSERLNDMPAPRAMIAIGGPSKTHHINDDDQAAHLAAAEQLLEQGYGLLVTTSRRTPDNVADRWKQLADRAPSVWLHGPDSTDDNPYFAFLGAADIILVTEDSTNMLTEACTTGKPVFRLPMSGDPGKFANLYRALETSCGVKRFDGTLNTPEYTPLRETDRVASLILDRIKRSEH